MQGQELMKIIPLDDIWVTANFKENQLHKVRAGQPVTISVDAFEQEIQRPRRERVPETSGRVSSLLPPENATGNYVKVVQRVPVKIAFDPGETKEHILRPGMSVEPKVSDAMSAAAVPLGAAGNGAPQSIRGSSLWR